MKYHSPTETDKYKTVKNPTLIDDIIPNIQIGDILIDSYHVVLIYDLVKDNEGKVIDGIIMDSFPGMGKSYVNSKIYRGSLPLSSEESFLGGNLYLNSKLNTDLEEGLMEGSITIKLLSKYERRAYIDNPSWRPHNI